DLQVVGEPGVAHLRDQAVEVLQARLGGACRSLLRAAQDADEAAHLGERLAAGLLDDEQRLALLLLVLLQQPPHCRRLDGHAAHAVTAAVVECRTDPGPLLDPRRARTLLTLALEPLGLGPELAHLDAALVEEDADKPRCAEERPRPDVVADRGVGEALVDE